MGLQQYLQDTQAELRHVAWPTRTQTIVFTTLVVALSIFVAVYLGLFDYLFQGSVKRFVESNAVPQNTAALTASSTSATSSSSPAYNFSATSTH